MTSGFRCLLLFLIGILHVSSNTLRVVATAKITSCSTPAVGSQSNLVNSGGPVLLHSKIYAIFWGAVTAWPSDFPTAAIDYLSHINGTSQLKLMQQYMGTATPITSSFGGSKYDTKNIVPTKILTSKDYGAEACRMYPTPDPNGIYVVFSNVAPQQMTFCAQHGSYTCNGKAMSVSWVPNLAIQPLYDICSVFSKPVQKNFRCNTYSNGTQAIMLSLAHEIYESITDPLGNAWRDSSGSEIGDKCSGACYSQCTRNSNGVGWELQPQWSNALKSCAYGV